MLKILLTWAKWMLASDFVKYCWKFFEIFAFDKQELDITKSENIENIISKIKPDIILNCAAYTAVDDAEDIWKLLNYHINTLWVYNLAKIANKYNSDFITLSSDYVFDGRKQDWYNEYDICKPINEYGMSKYLGEILAKEENENTIIIRTSWLYGWWESSKNFVNTILKLSQIKNELKIINEQFWLPTYTKDLNFALKEIIENIWEFRWNTLHLSNSWKEGISWFDFANEIGTIRKIPIKITPCSEDEYPTKAKRPKYSFIKNNSRIILRSWKEWLKDYLNNL